MYQRNVKIYKGIDNVIEIELKNNDQKRIEIGTSALKMVLMDQSRNMIAEYAAQSLEDSTIVGLARVVIPAFDLDDLDPQYLSFIVTKTDNGSIENLTYADSQFGAFGTIQLLNGINVVTTKTNRYDRFWQSTNWQGKTFESRVVSYISEAIPTTFYGATPATSMTITIYPTNFKGDIIIEGTDKEVIGHESFLSSTQLFQQEYSATQTTPIIVPNLNITNLTYLRIKYRKTTGSIDYVTSTV